jgi:hypothetical protein
MEMDDIDMMLALIDMARDKFTALRVTRDCAAAKQKCHIAVRASPKSKGGVASRNFG